MAFPPRVGGKERSSQHWVVGFDGSASAEVALSWTVFHAMTDSVKVHVVLAWMPLDGDPDPPGPIGLALATKRAGLDPVEQRCRDLPVEVEFFVEYGSPAQTLLRRAEGASLLVVGSRGLSVLPRVLLGSTSRYCAGHSPVPVVVVPPEASPDRRIERILVGMDASNNAKAALRWALGFAASATDIEVFGAWKPPRRAARTDVTDYEELAAAERDRFHRAVDEIQALKPFSNRVTRNFCYAKPATALVERGAQADLIVVGARGRSAAAAAVLGSVSTSVLRHAQRPVVVVPANDQA